MQLHAVNKKQPTKKFMGRERKTVEKEGKKHHPEVRLQVRDNLEAGEDDLGRGHQKALLLSVSQICFHESGSGPAHSLLLHGFLRHLVAMGNALDGHAMVRHLELKREHGRKEEEEVVAAEKQISSKQ
jgi:hypothetical protein